MRLIHPTYAVPLAPIERFVVPAELDGRDGSNRAPRDACRMRATNDRAALLEWLSEYVAVPMTAEAYRAEAERLLLWAVIERQVAFSSLGPRDMAAYERFLGDPRPADRWVMPRSDFPPARRMPVNDSNWRPFSGPVTGTRRRFAIQVLRLCFSFLVERGYLLTDPIAERQAQNQQRAAAAAELRKAG